MYQNKTFLLKLKEVARHYHLEQAKFSMRYSSYSNVVNDSLMIVENMQRDIEQLELEIEETDGNTNA